MDNDSKRTQRPRNSSVRDEMRAKGLDKLLIRVYGVRLQAVEPPYHSRPQARRKDFAHQSFIFEWTAILWLNWLTCSTGSV